MSTTHSDSPKPDFLPLPISHNMLPDFSPYGRGGDWSTQPLGEILDHIQDGKKFRMVCMKYNCRCGKDHA